MSIELFDGLVSPEIAGVLDEAMRAMPDSAVSVAPGRHGSGRVHVSIGGGSYDLSVTIDGGDTVASLELVHVSVGRAGNAAGVLKAGLGVLAAADWVEQRTLHEWAVGDETWTYDQETRVLACLPCAFSEVVDPNQRVSIARVSGYSPHPFVVCRVVGGLSEFALTEGHAKQMAEGLRKAFGQTGELNAWNVWSSSWGSVRWDSETRHVVVDADMAPSVTRSGLIDGELKYSIKLAGPGDSGGVRQYPCALTIHASGCAYQIDFETREEAKAFARWLDERIREGRE
jgi:hypothetical protein